ncbi:MAG TPA: PIG-L family deacetylase [Acidimicrobiia bacterium]
MTVPYPRQHERRPERVVVSPHLDDAVLSCGALIAADPGTLVVTVFAGRPQPGLSGEPTDWDRSCGFAAGDDVLAARRHEDDCACAALGAEPRWLDFVDYQYGEPVAVDEIAAELGAVIEALAPAELFVPLGLVHPDHDRTHRACRLLIGRTTLTVFAYEDLPYRALEGAVDTRITELDAAGLNPRRVDLGVDGRDARKHEAIACYASQARGLAAAWPGYERVLTREYYWRLGA